MHKSVVSVALAGAVLTGSAGVEAATYYVDGNNPAAADTNAGTQVEAPLKSVQAALDKTGPGDTVLLRGGVYREPWRLRRDGLPGRYITLRPFGDEPVVFTAAELKSAAEFQPVEGKSNVYWVAYTNGGHPMVYGDGRYLKARPAALGDGDVGCFHADNDRQRIAINTGDGNPGAGHRIEVVPPCGFALDRPYGRVIGLTFEKVQHGISLGGIRDMVEDCVFRDVWVAVSACGPHTDGHVVRRCTIERSYHNGIWFGNGSSRILVEDNLMVQAACDPAPPDLWIGGMKMNGANLCTFRNNVVLKTGVGNGGQYKGWAIWGDIACSRTAIIGNTAYDNVGPGIYIEYTMSDTVVMYNTLFRNSGGVSCRQAFRTFVGYNWIFLNRGTGMGPWQTNIRLGSVDNTFVANLLRDNPVAVGADPDFSREQEWVADGLPLNTFDRNIYKIPPGGSAARWGKDRYDTVEAFRAATGCERHGREGQAVPAELGLSVVTFRNSLTDKPEEAVPMIANSGAELIDPIVEMGDRPYFWRAGYADPTFQDWWQLGGVSPYPHDPFPCRYAGVVACEWADVDPVKEPPHSGFRQLRVQVLDPARMHPDGAGWWSVSLPTVGGAKLTVALWVKAQNVAPTSGTDGVVAFLRFTDANGQRSTRAYLVGGDTATGATNAGLLQGSYEWTRVTAVVTAPEHAQRCALFMGLRGGTGTVYYDDIELQTEGADPLAPKAAAKPAAPAGLTFVPLDLSRFVNRAFADKVDNDGKGGWSDQGPKMDLRHAPTGKQVIGGVPFMVLKGRSCVVLKSQMRKSDTLPAAVTIPVGRRAAVLYFLHSGAWVNASEKQWEYVIRYTDGRQVTIPVVGGVNLRDWSDSVPSIPFYEETDTTTTAAITVPQETFGQGTIWRMEWVNPRPDAEIAAIEFVSAGKGVPILVAITAGVR